MSYPGLMSYQNKPLEIGIHYSGIPCGMSKSMGKLTGAVRHSGCLTGVLPPVRRCSFSASLKDECLIGRTLLEFNAVLYRIDESAAGGGEQDRRSCC